MHIEKSSVDLDAAMTRLAVHVLGVLSRFIDRRER
jgi:hypothetical protein